MYVVVIGCVVVGLVGGDFWFVLIFWVGVELLVIYIFCVMLI